MINTTITSPLSVEAAGHIYDVLCLLGANQEHRNQFLDDQTQSFVGEWRFRGRLGRGGKFRRTRTQSYVDCYSEDRTADRDADIEHANRLIRLTLSSGTDHARRATPPIGTGETMGMPQGTTEQDHPEFGPIRRTQFNTLKPGDTVIHNWAILGTVASIVETSEMHGTMKVELDNGRRLKIQSWGHKRLWRKVDPD